MKNKLINKVLLKDNKSLVNLDLESILGLAIGTIGQQPINGLRVKPEKNANGWYIWCGENFSEEDDFFSPIHSNHIENYIANIMDFLELPPGYRFLFDCKGYIDIWYDEDLLIL